MKTVFADRFYYLGLVNPGDGRHSEAVEFSRKLPVCSITTAWVLTEVADAPAGLMQRGVFLALLNRLRHDPTVTIVPPSQSLFDRGIELYARRPDKEWSLTDSISFVVMHRHGITDALTGDRHFEQAGFTILLK
jgi:predicted nucleic acid-binding protein